MVDASDRLSAALAGRYTILRQLGRGGMATVYLAEDERHHRKVAIKVLLPEVSALLGAERFLQEIAVTANLQHPNILPLFDSGRVAPTDVASPAAEGPSESRSLLYYVMPYVEGESLRDRLDRERHLPVEDAVSIAQSVAAALQYAHEHGVVHRDIKPENILLQAGQALVADFGIALAITEAGGHRLTQTGLSVGTPAYMSPEQASGEPHIDARSDVYSLGSVLYEMLAGEPPHTGATAQAVIARVLADDPVPLGDRRKSVPPELESAVLCALQKLPADRFRSAQAFAEALGVRYATPVPAVRAARWPRGHERMWMLATAALAVVSLALGALAIGGSHGRVGGPEVKVRMDWPADQAPDLSTGFALSSDGTQIVYLGPDHQLWLRALNDLASHPLAGTAHAENPFFSPDGRSVAFFTRTPHSLKVVPVGGGPVRTLVEDSADVYGGDWTRDGMVYYTSLAGGIWRVPAGGGPTERVSRPDSSGNYFRPKWVDVLPNGKAALLSIWRGSAGSAEVGLLNLKTGRTVPLFRGTYARYAAGHVVYATPEGGLAVVPFDENRLSVTGGMRVAADSVLGDVYFGRAQFALAESGTLLYKRVDTASKEELVWVTPDGSATPVDTTLKARFNSLALSPDGRRVAVSTYDGGRQDIWVKDLKVGSLTRVSLEDQSSVNYRPQWTADGRSLTYVSDRGGSPALWLQRVDGSAPPKLLVSDPRMIDEGFLTPDGAWIVYRTYGANQNTRDIYAVPVGHPSAGRKGVATSVADEYSPTLSPDGRWLAYVSEESGRREVYVRPFPNTSAGRWLVSVDGGSEPVWDHTGRRLFYKNARLELMEVDIAAGPNFAWSPPRPLFDAAPFEADVYHSFYALAPDDRRFLMVRPVTQGENVFVLVVNWFAELK